ncbi:DNA topoisomerase IB [Abyssalbus ytuae]|uniref:DNA topoisomerase n=1 Tax=Abyssalbus ytuae TaxID=2926907 RepID=A0A9E7CTS5_9FLAO|nr:DNA topoisomerase IB [Abyssalbus ytuae]UOB16722.1 DNA topoisomerase IB [Abyssalbus ytuae]
MLGNSSGIIKKMMYNPDEAIKKHNLVYINESNLPILRKRRGRGFSYIYNGKPLNKKEELARIKNLVIPPAWDNVKISSLHNGHLQAVGKDLKKRKQYLYHPLWHQIRNQTKFYKMKDFAKKLPMIRRQVEKDLNQHGWPKTKVLALVVKLMEETHIRIGSEKYARRNKTYGLSTLRNKHVHIYDGKMKFEFVGKKGKRHSVSVKNKKLIKLVSQCEEIPGWELFQFYDENGVKSSIDSKMVNDYLQEITGDLFTAKDFRTWAACIVFFEELLDTGITNNEKEMQSNLVAAYKVAAKALGNTRNVCKKYYVHPYLVSTYQSGSIANAFKEAGDIKKSNPYFSSSEEAFFNLIKNYEPKILFNEPDK